MAQQLRLERRGVELSVSVPSTTTNNNTTSVLLYFFGTVILQKDKFEVASPLSELEPVSVGRLVPCCLQVHLVVGGIVVRRFKCLERDMGSHLSGPVT